MSEEFKTWAQNVVLFNHITSRIAGAKYGNLLSEKGGKGFPYLVFMDAEGNVVAQHKGARDAGGFAKTAEKAKQMLDVRAKAAAGDPGAQFDVLLIDLEMSTMPPADAEAKVKALGALSADQKARLDPALLANEIRHVLSTVTREQPTQVHAGRQFVAMLKAGRTPTSPEVAGDFYFFVMLAAEEDKDAATFEQALGEMKKALAGNPRAEQFMEQAEARLKALKGG